MLLSLQLLLSLFLSSFSSFYLFGVHILCNYYPLYCYPAFIFYSRLKYTTLWMRTNILFLFPSYAREYFDLSWNAIIIFHCMNFIRLSFHDFLSSSHLQFASFGKASCFSFAFVLSIILLCQFSLHPPPVLPSAFLSYICLLPTKSC